MKKWTFLEESYVILVGIYSMISDISIYKQCKFLQKLMPYRSWESIRSKLNRVRGIKK